ncbi:septation protein spoVG [Bacillus sp. BGMRC 2118]|nr:septation protein spoVG [Bacillus sp. BGMRC 2118]
MSIFITNIDLRLVNDEHSRMKAICSVTLNHEFVVHDIRVIETSHKVLVAMPSKRKQTGQFTDVAHPITKELREQIEAVVFTEYDSMKRTKR